jgi:hypothetical protein
MGHRRWLTCALVEYQLSYLCCRFCTNARRWAIDSGERGWIAFDLGGTCNVTGLMLDWGVGEYAEEYDIEVSTDGRYSLAVSRRLLRCSYAVQNSLVFLDDCEVSGVAAGTTRQRPFHDAMFLSFLTSPPQGVTLIHAAGRRARLTWRAHP